MDSNFKLKNVDIDIEQILKNLENVTINYEEDKEVLESFPSYKGKRRSVFVFFKLVIRAILKKGWHAFLAIYIALKNLFRKKSDSSNINGLKDEEIRVVQLVSTYINNDAIGNDVTQVGIALDKLGYKNIIVTSNTLNINSPKVLITTNYKPRKNDIFLYHMCIGSEPMTKIMKKSNVRRKIMIYHNITPSKYFVNDARNRKATTQGRKELKELAPYFDATLSVSDYNRQELIALNYKNNGVLPVFYLDEALKNAKLVSEIYDKFDDGITNILFVGRMSYNKTYEDLIKTFYVYHKYFNQKSRLILVGKETDPSYTSFLMDLVEKTGMTDSIVWQKASGVDELATVYKSADLFLIESEHEGFCVPLLEAMLFKIPIVAYASSAIPDTLGDAGILFNEKDHFKIASSIDILIKDESTQKMLIERGETRLKQFSYDNVFKIFEEAMKKNII